MKNKNKIFICIQFFSFVLLSWICPYCSNTILISDIFYKEERYSVEKILRTRLLAKNNFKYEGTIDDLNGYISDGDLSTKSKYKKIDNYKNTDKNINKKIYENINKANIDKNLECEQLTDVKLDNMENNETPKKNISCKLNPFNEIDSHFDKNIKNIFENIYKNENNKKSNKLFLRMKLFANVCSMFVPYILILSMGFFFMHIDKMDWSYMILFPLGIIILLYILIKGIKYARLKRKGHKK
ncbi:Plasmodium exported protein, unknown function [Plasmodium vivax]|uniref:Uncharacterized protein n=1 Tax=Plasmodium vivax TaxID=5855 RepID=A0A565A5T3_PLAVI|nr:Plasmodium exported protein, unknown function [Plasmodium vivax]